MSKFITEKQLELQVTQVCLKFGEHDHTHKIWKSSRNKIYLAEA